MLISDVQSAFNRAGDDVTGVFKSVDHNVFLSCEKVVQFVRLD